MKIIKNTLIAISAFFFFSAANGGEIAGYKTFRLPLSDSAPAAQSQSFGILAKSADNEGEIASAANALLSAPQSELPAMLSNPSDVGKAEKFLKMAGLKSATFKCAKIGDYYIATFPKTKKMRAGMNFFAFEKIGGALKWNLSLSDPLLSLLASAHDCGTNAADANALSPADEKTVSALVKNDLPFLTFSNGALVSLEPASGVENAGAAKFYHKAQEDFFNCRLKSYAQFLSENGRNIFEKQFLSMTEAEQKTALKDYFSWTKKYQKVMRADFAASDIASLGKGGFDIIFFAREKSGETPQNDTAYISYAKDTPLIDRWGAAKSPLDNFLGRHILKDGDYFKSISDRFLKR